MEGIGYLAVAVGWDYENAYPVKEHAETQRHLGPGRSVGSTTFRHTDHMGFRMRVMEDSWLRVIPIAGLCVTMGFLCRPKVPT